MTRYFRIVAGLMGTSALSLTLSACKLDNQPLFGRDGAHYDAAPAVGPLDPGYPQDVAYLPPAAAYAYPERAYSVGGAAYSRPPNYAFAYDDSQPWAWDVADDGLMFAESYGDDWRYYYYEPGESYPYYVQDADYGYAYGDNGVLLALFTAAGALIASDRYDDHHPRSGYYWTRGLDLRRSYYGSPRYAVDETVWRARARVVRSGYDRWRRAFEAQPGWREAQRHDNGRHLGWSKDRRGATQVAIAAAPQRIGGDRVIEKRDGRRNEHWREGREVKHARGQHELQRRERHEDREPPAGPQTRQERGPQQKVRVARAQETRGYPAREARQEHGGRQQARNVGSNARDASSKGPDRPKAQHGGGGGGNGRGDGGPGGGQGKGRDK